MLLPHAISVTSEPTEAPVTRAQIKAHLLVEHDADDDWFDAMLFAATRQAQRESNLYLMPQTVEVSFAEADFRCLGDRLELPVWPVRALASVQYLDADGATQTWGSGSYQAWLAHRPPLVSPGYGESWPTLRAGALRAIWFTCAAGYANFDAVPEEAKHAIKLIVAHAYANKGDGRDPTGEAGIPPAAMRFLDFMRRDFYR